MSLRVTVVIVLVTVAHAFGGVFSYECDSLPLDAGWTLIQAFCDPSEWIDDGRLFQRVEFCPGYDPPQGQQFDYTRSLAEFAGTDDAFFEWRLETDGDRSELIYTAPAVFLASNGGGVTFHFTIAADQIRFIRDDQVLYIDVEAGVPHTYRLEVNDDDWYALYIDGVPIDAGLPEGRLLREQSVVNTRAKAKFVESTTIWYYIRWGAIPADGSGDFDSDGRVGSFDLYYFEECFLGPGVDAGPGCRFADFGGDGDGGVDTDGDVDLRDFAAFQNAFTGGEP